MFARLMEKSTLFPCTYVERREQDYHPILECLMSFVPQGAEPSLRQPVEGGERSFRIGVGAADQICDNVLEKPVGRSLGREVGLGLPLPGRILPDRSPGDVVAAGALRRILLVLVRVTHGRILEVSTFQHKQDTESYV